MNPDFLFFYLFPKNDELGVLFLGQSSHDLGNLQGSQGFIVFSSHFHVNATVCSHGKGSTDGLLRDRDVRVHKNVSGSVATICHCSSASSVICMELQLIILQP